MEGKCGCGLAGSSILWLIVSFSLKPSIKIMAETFGCRSICFWGHLVVVRNLLLEPVSLGYWTESLSFSLLVRGCPLISHTGRPLLGTAHNMWLASLKQASESKGTRKISQYLPNLRTNIPSTALCSIIVTEFLDLINTQGWGITQECIKSGND